jgi:hypothetical protein
MTLKISRGLVLLATVALCLAAISGCDRREGVIPNNVSILFVGNSFVSTGNVPKQIKVLSKMYGVNVSYTSISPGGSSLDQSKERAIKKMHNRAYDFAVFQDYGTRPHEPAFFDDVKELCDTAKGTGAVPVLYNPAWTNIDAVPNKEHQDELTALYERAAKENGAILVNAGDAWVYAYEKLPGLSLYRENDYHANDAGAYLTACVFASTLFDLHVKDVAAANRYHGEDAIALGQAAWEFVSSNKDTIHQ